MEFYCHYTYLVTDVYRKKLVVTQVPTHITSQSVAKILSFWLQVDLKKVTVTLEG